MIDKPPLAANGVVCGISRFAIVGAGPSGLYTAQALRRALPGCEIDVLDRLPVPFGLIRYGVAPDHQGTKAITRQFERLFERDGVQFFGNVAVNTAVPVSLLTDFYDAVVLATGLAGDRQIRIPGDGLEGVFGSGLVTRWLNSHPDECCTAPNLGPDVVIVGQGNVAIDIARVLGKQAAELETSDMAQRQISSLAQWNVRQIDLVGRGLPSAARFDPAMIRELATLQDVRIEVVWPNGNVGAGEGTVEAARIQALRQIDGIATGNATRTIRFRFNLVPNEIISSDGGAPRVSALRCHDATTGDHVTIPASSVVTAIGFCADTKPHTIERPGDGELPMELRRGLYATGWYRRGPRGTIPDCRQDAKLLAEAIAATQTPASGKLGRSALIAYLKTAAIRHVDYDGWLRIRARGCSRYRTTPSDQAADD